MKKEFNLMLVIVVCAIIGVVLAVLAGQLNTQGVIDGWLTEQGLSINNFQFLLFIGSLFCGIVLGVIRT